MEEQIESDFPFQKVPAMLLFILLESRLNHTTSNVTIYDNLQFVIAQTLFSSRVWTVTPLILNSAMN